MLFYPEINYPVETLIVHQNEPWDGLYPNISDFRVVSWSIQPMIPRETGLTFSNGVISGTPLIKMEKRLFVIIPCNERGCVNVDLYIMIDIPKLESISYNPDTMIFPIGFLYESSKPIIVGELKSYATEGEYPAEIKFNQLTGIFSGIAAEPESQFQVTVIGVNPIGNKSTEVNLNIIRM